MIKSYEEWLQLWDQDREEIGDFWIKAANEKKKAWKKQDVKNYALATITMREINAKLDQHYKYRELRTEKVKRELLEIEAEDKPSGWMLERLSEIPESVIKELEGEGD